MRVIRKCTCKFVIGKQAKLALSLYNQETQTTQFLGFLKNPPIATFVHARCEIHSRTIFNTAQLAKLALLQKYSAFDENIKALLKTIKDFYEM